MWAAPSNVEVWNGTSEEALRWGGGLYSEKLFAGALKFLVTPLPLITGP